MSEPAVSVAMPVFNGARFLAETLDSWLAQEFGDFELIVSDNASTDATPDILAQYAAKDSRLRVLRRPETVIAWDNYNGLVPEARAPLFTWSACDDLREPAFLARLIAALEADPEAILAYSHFRYFGDERRAKRHKVNEEPPGEQESGLARAMSLLRVREAGPIYGLIRSHELRKTHLFHYPMGIPSDTALQIELAVRGRMVCVREPLMAFRLHDHSLSVSPDDPIWSGRRGRVYDAEAQAFMQELPLPEAQKRILCREMSVWCRKAQHPRRGLWKSGGFRSAYVHGAQLWNDVMRRVHRV